VYSFGRQWLPNRPSVFLEFHTISSKPSMWRGEKGEIVDESKAASRKRVGFNDASSNQMRSA
jgi:hypothetical protein